MSFTLEPSDRLMIVLGGFFLVFGFGGYLYIRWVRNDLLARMRRRMRPRFHATGIRDLTTDLFPRHTWER